MGARKEMVLNHVSVCAPGNADSTAWLADIARGMASLIEADLVRKVLRMHRSMHEIWCRPSHSLFDACQALRPHDRDAYAFLMRLTQKVPLCEGLGQDATSRFLACENQRPSGEDGEPLLLCALNEWIAVGFPSSSDWDKDCLRIEFEELLPSGEIENAREDIDNLSRAAHADAILDRSRRRCLDGITPAQVWTQRQALFPSLHFGPEVERHLGKQSRLLPQILGKLLALDASARAWKTGPAPTWNTNVTPESDDVRQAPKLRDARLFESERGGRKLFEWHARVGSGVRIHLRFDAGDRSIEIGYIGSHLPIE